MVWGSSFAGAVGDIDVNGNLEADTATINQSTDTQSLTSADSVTVTDGEATDTLHYGSNQDRANAGDDSLAVGINSRVQSDRSTAIGAFSCENHSSGPITAVGFKSAENNAGAQMTTMGTSAGQDNAGQRVSAFGVKAAQFNSGNNLTSVGLGAGRKNTGDRVTVVGFQAGRGDGLTNPSTMGSDNIGVGQNAIANNQASGLIAIGQDAGINAQTDDQLIITDRNGNRRMVMDLDTGDLDIEGSLSQNANL
jgi:hypothetical protein